MSVDNCCWYFAAYFGLFLDSIYFVTSLFRKKDKGLQQSDLPLTIPSTLLSSVENIINIGNVIIKVVGITNWKQ